MNVDAALAALRTLVAHLVREELASRQPANDDLLTPQEAAAVAKVAPATVRRWIRDGRLPCHRAGRHLRVRRAELETMLASGARDTSKLTPEQAALRDFG